MFRKLILAAALAAGGLASQSASAAPLNAAGPITVPGAVEQAQFYFGFGGPGPYYGPRPYYGRPYGYYGPRYYGPRPYYGPRRYYGRPYYRRRYYY